MHSRHGHGHMMRDAYKKYGFNNFAYEAIYSNVKSDDLLDYAERFWIKVMGSMAPNGYNLEEGGKRGYRQRKPTNVGKKASDETRKKMSESQRKHWDSLESHPNKGKRHTEETKAKMSKSRTGRVQSESERKMRSEAIKLWHKNRKEQV